MAAKVPTSVKFLSSGNGITHIIAVFDNIDTTDTWTSGIKGIVTLHFASSDAGTLDGAVSATATAEGVITFLTADDNQAGTLHIYRR